MLHLQACAGFYAYFVVMATNGFYPTRLFGLRAHWDNQLINDVEDVFGQQWVR
jgi:sodium/potassium-transporting ATPase subunit alpha